MQRNWNPQTLVSGMSNGTAAMEDTIAVPQKVKHGIPT